MINNNRPLGLIPIPEAKVKDIVFENKKFHINTLHDYYGKTIELFFGNEIFFEVAGAVFRKMYFYFDNNGECLGLIERAKGKQPPNETVLVNGKWTVCSVRSGTALAQQLWKLIQEEATTQDEKYKVQMKIQRVEKQLEDAQHIANVLLLKVGLSLTNLTYKYRNYSGIALQQTPLINTTSQQNSVPHDENEIKKLENELYELIKDTPEAETLLAQNTDMNAGGFYQSQTFFLVNNNENTLNRAAPKENFLGNSLIIGKRPLQQTEANAKRRMVDPIYGIEQLDQMIETGERHVKTKSDAVLVLRDQAKQMFIQAVKTQNQSQEVMKQAEEAKTKMHALQKEITDDLGILEIFKEQKRKLEEDRYHQASSLTEPNTNPYNGFGFFDNDSSESHIQNNLNFLSASYAHPAAEIQELLPEGPNWGKSSETRKS